ncbi:hypothetical protein F5884DRAFT_663758 [Xylogone sp. PMI_703]|nr:hypothetical protein F5884DRAFT_663758 [Xylogone sp. PMI_703]
MIAALVAGILLAMGHHLFYSSLAGRVVGSGDLVGGISKQQVNFALGTMFAFLVNSLLALAVTTSYIQIAWKAIKKEETRISTIDTIFSVTTNVYALAKIPTWLKHPLLLLLAATLWCIPISSVITPATLSVELAQQFPIPTADIFVPNVDFLSLNFASVILAQGLGVSWLYSGPQFAVRKVVVATAAQGQILPIHPVAPNSSWALEFAGPSLKCNSIQGQQHEDIIKNINSTVQVGSCQSSYGYISWTPDPTTGSLPFIQGTGLDNDTFTPRTATLGSGNFTSGNDHLSDVASIFIATLPGMVNERLTEGCTNVSLQLANATILQCGLFNASYHASFNYINGIQTIDISQDNNLLNDVSPVQFLWTDATTGPLEAFFPNGSVNHGAYNLTEVQTLAYQSVLDALGQILVGSISNSHDSAGAILNANTSVMSTVLSDTAELQHIATYPQPNAFGISTLQQDIAENPLDYNGLSVANVAVSNTSLQQELEDLFQNIVISLMSSSLLQPNRSSPYAPPSTLVFLPQYRNIFIYSPWKLWLAYGISILFSTTGVIIGLFAMLSNGASYNNNFSTILRTSKHANINTAINPVDATGREPLPKYLAKAAVLFPRLHDMQHGGSPPAADEYLEVSSERKAANANSMLLGPRGEGY